MSKLFGITWPLLTVVSTWGCGSEATATPPNTAGTGGTGGNVAGASGSSSNAQGGSSTAQGGGGAAAGASTSSGGTGGAAAGAAGASGQGGQAQAGGSAGGSGEGGNGGAPLLPLEECTGKPSIDRLTEWNASGEGLTVPPTGTIVVEQGGGHVAKVQFVGAEWHVIPVLVANKFGTSADFSSSKGITLTYSATSELHVQLRSKSHWSGGDQYAADIPATGGQRQTLFVAFDAAGWKSLFGAPTLSYADTLKEAMGLVFVGNSQNDVVFYGLRIDGFTPVCP